MISVLRDLFAMIRLYRKWWLAPMILVMALLGGFFVLVEALPAISPFIYTVF